MSRLFRGMSSKKGKSAESTVKQSLVTQLSAAVKDLQIDQADEYMLDTESNDSTNVLCTILEAMFLHGLKDSFLRRVTIAVRPDIDERPEPNFWAPLLVVSHRNVIDQISKLNLLTSDIGRCRAWIRLALNEGLMSRYFETIMKEGQRALSQYYRASALLRDTEALDVAQRLMEGVEAVPLNLPLNSSLLDTWTQQPLILSGLWTPPLRATALHQAVSTGVEVAEEDLESQSDARSLMSFPGTGIEQMVSLKEEDALRIILGTPVFEAPIAARGRAEESLKDSEGREDESVSEREAKAGGSTHAVSVQGHIEMQDNETTDVPNEVNVDDVGQGNSLAARSGWSSSFELKDTDTGANLSMKIEEKIDGNKPLGRQRGRKIQSFQSLIESYHGAISTSTSSPTALDDFLQQFEAPAPDNVTDPETTEEMDEYCFLLQQMTKLPLEKGLDSQKYECFTCSLPIGLNSVPAKVCGLSGRYVCKDCITLPGEEWVVPSRIVHNWDFRRVAVSRRAAAFLNDIQEHPLFDFNLINPRIYSSVEEMMQLQTLRTQLTLLGVYLFNCQEQVLKVLEDMVWPRVYFLKHVHLYCLTDLLEIPTGSLAKFLKKAINFARDHVFSCPVCKQKGFFCEVCDRKRGFQEIIYPFDCSTTDRCPDCRAEFHSACVDAAKPESPSLTSP